MKQLILTFLILVGHLAFSQERNDLIGSWKVLQVKVPDDIQPPSDQVEQMKMLKEVFNQSTFDFYEDGRANFNVSISDIEIKNGYWVFDEINKKITIKEWKDKDNPKASRLMDIVVQNVEGKLIFWIEESPFGLIMSRN